jgi:hypothetical protein
LEVSCDCLMVAGHLWLINEIKKQFAIEKHIPF